MSWSFLGDASAYRTRRLRSFAARDNDVALADPAHRHRDHPIVMAGQRLADRLPGGGVPHPHRPIVTSGDDDVAAVDRGMTAAQVADDSLALAGAAWTVGMMQ
jgi:hypothetical protein